MYCMYLPSGVAIVCGRKNTISFFKYHVEGDSDRGVIILIKRDDDGKRGDGR